MYKGRPFWNTEKTNKSYKEIKYYSNGKYFTSLDTVPDSDFEAISEIDNIEEIINEDSGAYDIFRIPSPPKFLDFVNDTYKRINIDGIIYNAILKEGNVVWDYYMNGIKYVEIDNGELKYFTSWKKVQNKNNSYSIYHKSDFDFSGNVSTISAPLENKKITIIDNGSEKIYGTILINGKWYWQASKTIAKTIKFVDSEGKFYTKNNITQSIASNKSLSSVTVPESIFKDSLDEFLDQNETLTKNNINFFENLYFNNKIYNYKFKDGVAQIPQDIYKQIHYVTLVNGIKKYYSSYYLIPENEISSSNSILIKSDLEENFLPINLLTLLPDNEEIKIFNILNKNGIYEKVEIYKDKDDIIKTSNVDLLLEVKYIDSTEALFTTLSPESNKISSLILSEVPDQSNKNVTSFFQKTENNLSFEFSILMFGSISLIVILSMIILIRKRK
ncbi:MAG: hypothetical protein HRT99_04340 [Mycoplasmatales bacterium]|nr:hypothetical protein [Mycoplasmatales bacterium]